MTFSPGAPHFQAEDKHVGRGLKTMPPEAEPDRHGEGKVGMRRGYFLIPAGLLWGGVTDARLVVEAVRQQLSQQNKSER